MKVLSIGNSFSTDAQRWLQPMAESAGVDLYVANLYIGGCSLQQHWDNFCAAAVAYDYEVNGEFTKKISIQEALTLQDWDVVTLQQVSGDSGDYTSFQTCLNNLIQEVKKACPHAELYLHKTWNYEPGSGHPDFVKYGCDSAAMIRCITTAYAQASKETGLPVIPTGDVIFGLQKQGVEVSLYRDSFHLSLDYGRFVAGLVWLFILTGTKADKVTFVPCVEGNPANATLLAKLKEETQKILDSIL